MKAAIAEMEQLAAPDRRDWMHQQFPSRLLVLQLITALIDGRISLGLIRIKGADARQASGRLARICADWRSG